jgi:translation initiation factor IF-2
MIKRSKRIFQIAKEFNISHTEILNFLKEKGVDVSSHMSPVDDDAYSLIKVEFARDKENVDRYRKEQVRREIHHSRIAEQQKISKKLNLLSLEEQRKLEKEEKAKEIEVAKLKEQEKEEKPTI